VSDGGGLADLCRFLLGVDGACGAALLSALTAPLSPLSSLLSSPPAPALRVMPRKVSADGLCSAAKRTSPARQMAKERIPTAERTASTSSACDFASGELPQARTMSPGIRENAAAESSRTLPMKTKRCPGGALDGGVQDTADS